MTNNEYEERKEHHHKKNFKLLKEREKRGEEIPSAIKSA